MQPAQPLNSNPDIASLLEEKQHGIAVINAVESFILVLDSNGTILEINDAALRMTLTTHAEALGLKADHAKWWAFSEENRVEISSLISHVLKTKRKANREIRYLSESQEIRSMDFWLSPITKSNGDVAFLVGTGFDIQTAKSFQSQLIQSKIEADISNQAKSAFLAHMSHELRTPLGAVLGFADLALEETDLEEKNRALEIILNNGKQVLALVDEVLDLVKIEAGKMNIDIRDVRLKEIVEEIEKPSRLKALERGLTLQIETSPKAPLWIRTDPLRLKQILQNIIGNAIKYTDQGKVKVVISKVADSVTREPLLQFEVTDTGMGIPFNEIPHLFEPFTRGSNVIKKNYPGTGLGLALSRRLARVLGGDLILVKSEAGVETTFIVTIAENRSVSSEIAHMRNISEPPPYKQTEQKILERLHGMRLLVVDDVAENRILITKYLQKEGAIVVTASNGEEAIQLGLNDGFHAVLMDLSMPITTGQEATQELRHHGYKIPILALTAHAMREEKEKALTLGFTDYLTKPIVKDVLIEALAKIYEASKRIQ